MSLEEIRESGIIERYVLGQCSQEEIASFEMYLKEYPELNENIEMFARSLGNYAKLHNVAPSAGMKTRILNEIGNLSSSSSDIPSAPKTSRTPLIVLTSLLLASLIFGAYQYFQVKQGDAEIAIAEEKCDSLLEAQKLELQSWNDVKASDNQIYAFTATDGYKGTSVQIISNPVSRRNYLMASALPEIAQDEAFQLWSLKEGQDPIPMNVFTKNGQFIIPLDYEAGTPTYAVTIEKAAGAKSPNLAKLIGTFSVV